MAHAQYTRGFPIVTHFVGPACANADDGRGGRGLASMKRVPA